MQIEDLVYVEEIMWYNGPVISQYRDKGERDYINWAISDNSFLWFQTDKKGIKALLDGEVTCLQFWQGAKAYFMTTDDQGGLGDLTVLKPIKWTDVDPELYPLNDVKLRG